MPCVSDPNRPSVAIELMRGEVKHFMQYYIVQRDGALIE
jgi:hypothetical protein